MCYRIPLLILMLFLHGTHAQTPTKTVVAVLNLRNTSGVSEGEAELLSDRLRIELFNTASFSVMERAQMQDILKEQGFQQSGACTDEGCMVEIGQLLGVKFLIAGSIGKLGNMFLVNVRSINIGTGKIDRVVAEDIKGNLENVVDVLPRIASRLAGNSAPERVVSTRANEPQPTPSSEPQEEPSQPPEQPGVLPKAPVYLERFVASVSSVPFQLTTKEYDEVTQDINSDLLGAFNEMFDDRAVEATIEQLMNVTNQNVIVIRTRLLSYTTRPEHSGQFAGTAEVAFDFFMGSTPNPAFRLVLKKTGSRHWGAATPFTNAFEEIAEEIEDNLDDIDWVRSAWKKVR